MINGKYVSFYNEFGTRTVVCIPENVVHATLKHLNPVSAGFFTYSDAKGWSVYGKSISLNLECDEEEDLLAFRTAFRVGRIPY